MATIIDMGIDSENMGIYHPKHKNRWKITFIGLSSIRGESSQSFSAGVSPFDHAQTKNVESAITMQMTNFARPHLTWNEAELHRYNSIAYIQTKHSWDPVSFSLEDDVTSLASRALQAQMERQQYMIGALGGVGSTNLLAPAAVGQDYKFAAEAVMLDGGNTALEIWHMQGCWLKDVNYGEMDYSTGDPMKIEVSMRYDHAYQVFGDKQYGQALGGH